MAINAIMWFRSKTRVDSFLFDGTIRESHNYDLVLTENPIEVGANPVDHAYVRPVMVEIDVLVGDIYSLTAATMYNFLQRSADALAQLRQLMVNRAPINVVCNLAKYSNMMIKNIRATQDKATSSTLLATITLQELILIDDSSGSINVNNNNDQYQQQQNSGTKQGINQ